MSEYRLEMRGVCKSFPGVKALDNAQLKLRPGTVHALMGENGAGKSTLMKCMFGIYKMDEGEILYEGEKVRISDPFQALHMGIAMVHQELQPIPERSVAEKAYAIDVAFMNKRENAFAGENLGWRLETVVYLELRRRSMAVSP